jgi:hypothetical protein
MNAKVGRWGEKYDGTEEDNTPPTSKNWRNNAKEKETSFYVASIPIFFRKEWLHIN